MTPQVLYIGNFRPPHSSENEIASCFRALGWEVSRIQESDLVSGRSDEWRRLIHRSSSVDLVLYTRTWGLPEDRALELWGHCARVGVPSASLHLDLFFGLGSTKGQLPRSRMPSADPMFRTAHVFTPDGDHDEEWAAAGVNHHWLPPAIGCDSCFDGEVTPRWAGTSVAFVGSRGYHPEWGHRERLIAELERRFGPAFAHVSGETQRDGHAIRGQALHDLYASVPVIIGDSCWVDAQPPHTRYWSDRVPEVWGRGGFLLMPAIDALRDQLGPYPCWEPWDDLDALEEQARWWINHPADREAVRRELVELVRAEHTWSARIREMLALMGSTADETHASAPAGG